MGYLVQHTSPGIMKGMTRKTKSLYKACEDGMIRINKPRKIRSHRKYLSKVGQVFIFVFPVFWVGTCKIAFELCGLTLFTSDLNTLLFINSSAILIFVLISVYFPRNIQEPCHSIITFSKSHIRFFSIYQNR